MVDFIRGQLISIAFVIFILGLIFQLFQFFKLTKKKEWVYPPSPITSEKKTAGQWVAFCLASLNGTLWKTDPLMTIDDIRFPCLSDLRTYFSTWA